MTPSRVLGVRRLNNLFQRAASPIYVLDAASRIVYANAALENLTGQPSATLIGLVCRASGLPQTDDLVSLGGSLAPPLETANGLPAGVETLIVKTGGERFWMRAEFWPLRDGRGQAAGTFCLLRDRTTPSHSPPSRDRRLQAELRELRDRLAERHGFDSLIGQGLGHRRVIDQIKASSATNLPVTVVGEPGTGKRTVATAIHLLGGKPASALRHLDCAALPAEVLERALFEELLEKDGPADLSRGKTFVLANAFALPRDLQARLVKGAEGRPRVIATSPIPPDVAHRRGELRDDLFYALTTLVIPLQPLRERLEDVPLLAQHFLEQTNLRAARHRLGFVSGAMELLLAYDWPGNLRELSRVVSASHASAAEDMIESNDLPAAIRGHFASSYTPPPIPLAVTPLDERMNGLERRLIEQALHRARHNKSRAAELLDISRPRLYRRIKELNIPDIPEPADEPTLQHDTLKES